MDADAEAPAQTAAGMGMYDVEAVRARVRALTDRYQQTEEEVRAIAALCLQTDSSRRCCMRWR